MQPTNLTKAPSTINRDNPLIALASKDYGGIFVVELATGDRQKLEISGDKVINVIGWATNGCTLFVESEKQRIIKVDTKGKILGEISDINSLKLGSAIARIRISPDEQWIALVLGTGNQEFTSYEFQNLVTISSKGSNEIFKLTDGGVVNDVSWKFDFTMVAFADIDNDSIQQVFISSPNGSSKIQETHFNKKSLTIRSLKWSPTGEKIAFIIHNEERQESYIGIVETRDPDNVIFINSVIAVNEFFWLPNDRIIADILPSDNDPSKLADRAIAWFNSDTGQEVGRISPENLPGEDFQMPGLLANSDRIGFFSDNNFYAYDTSSMQIEKGFDMFADLRYWFSAPKVIEEESCNTPE